MTVASPDSGSKFQLTRLRKARLATFFGFFQLGAMILVWSTSTSPLREHLGWSGEGGDSNFGLLALSIGIGATVGCYAIGPFIDRFGPRNTTTFTLVLYPLVYIPLAFLGGLGAAMVFGAIIGLLRGAGDTAINAHGVQVERYYGRPIMSAFHAAYPAGGFFLGLVGSALARHFVDSPAVLYISTGVIMSLLGLAFGKWMLAQSELLPADAEVKADESIDRESTGPSKATATLLIMIGFGVLLLGSQLSEGAILDWGQEFVVRHVGTTVATAAAAVTVYSGAQFVGRLFGDRLAEVIGSRTMLAGSGVLGAAGALTAMSAGNATIALVGFGMMGLGLACMAPLMLSSAGRRDPANAGRNIGLVNALGYGGMLAGPAAITVIVEKFGIGFVPMLPAILLVLIAIFGPVLMKTAPKYRRREAAAVETATSN
ncbi:MFS transporter [Rhodococcus sp. Eu-32]|uniref:MFS transporter n=1 Tax=Rhodococcus sp. Eu-32 TaxID=1017319 RepID=UPI000DF32D5D|nr:MFS transporter [Rhodococcus sp. Eu-32]RRQ25274.1 MFS transporter [Rhodococcus sp. Eu-32]